MKTEDISQTFLVRKCGVRGARVFARIWFPSLYLALAGLAASLWVVGPELVAGWRRVCLGWLYGALVVLAASLLTRMRLTYLAAIESLNDRERALPKT